MKIQYKVGNLILADEIVIAHGCNAQGVMGAGVAKAIREYYPDSYRDYRTIYCRDGLRLGDVHFTRCYNLLPWKIIANCITQEFMGTDKRYVDYNAVKECMIGVNSYCHFHKYPAFALPKIGAGLAGGDWNVISKIIEEACTYAQPVVYVLTESEIPNQI